MAISQQSPTGPQCMFYAIYDSDIPNQTGDGTVYAIPFNKTLINVNGCFNTDGFTYGYFKVPSSGTYMFEASITSNYGAIQASYLNVNITGISNCLCQVNPDYSMPPPPDYLFTLNGSLVQPYAAAGDDIYLTVQAGGLFNLRWVTAQNCCWICYKIT